MKEWVGIGLLGGCCLVMGCNASRIAKLQKENADLKAKVEQQSIVATYDLQAKCSKDARAWFDRNWSRDKDTILIDFTDHYNAKLNKCFILVEDHYNSHLAAPGGDSWTNDMSLYDVYENAEYAQFSETHLIYWKPKYSSADEVITCEVSGSQCKTVKGFGDLVAPFMNE